MNDNILFRKATINDNFEEIASLIYQTDSYIYPFWFGSIENAKKVLPQYIREDGFFFNYKNLYVGILEDGSIVSLMCVVDRGTNFSFDYNSLRVVNENYKFTIDNYIMKLIEEVENAKYCYISNVCVSDKVRGLGIGNKMVKFVLDEIEKDKFNEIALDVLKNNPSALHLYEKMGFKITGEIVGFDGTDNSNVEVYNMMRDNVDVNNE